MGLSSKGTWLLKTSIGVMSPCLAANHPTRLGNGGAVTVLHSTSQIKQKVLSECERRSSTLDDSQTYPQKTNNLFSDIG